MAAAIPTLADPASRQVVQAIVDPLGYYRRCFRAHNGVVRVHMVPGFSPQQVLINDRLHQLTAGRVRQGGDRGGHRGEGQARGQPRCENSRPS